jgi:GAF domain-containing protein/CheY-like chemotaxis protein
MVGIAIRGWRLKLLAGLSCLPLMAQTTLSLREAGARNPSANYTPAHLNEKVILQGVVNASSYHFPDYKLLAIQDDQYGAVIKVGAEDNRLDAMRPGDVLEVTGTLSALAGMPVVLPDTVARVGRKAPPAPADVPLDALVGFRYLGRLVRTKAGVHGVGDTANGAYLLLAARSRFLVFMPRSPSQTTGLGSFVSGNAVRITGVAYQYCPRPPFNRYFQILVDEPGDIVAGDGGGLGPGIALGAALWVVVVVLLILWTREARDRKQRERLRKTYQLGEEILGSPLPETILKRLEETLPEVLAVTTVEIYLHNRASKTLDSLAGEGEQTISLPLLSAAGESPSGAVACFQFRSALAVPDAESSPFQAGGETPGRSPKSILFVPMLAQGEAIGVLRLGRHGRVRAFNDDEQQLAQHLANQAAVAVRLIEQRSVQERLFRTEKLAAVGRLISGVVNELRTPLASIADLANRALEAGHPAAERELTAIAAESRKAAEMVERLVSYAAAEQAEARPVAIGALLRTLIEFREADWKASGIRVCDLTTQEPLFVLGSQGQLEQVFLTLLVHAEQSLADSPQKLITIRTSVLAKRLLVEIAYTGLPVSRQAGEAAAVLGVTRSVVAGHGGEVRLIEKNNADPRFEVELPITAKERVSPAAIAAANGHTGAVASRLTALVIEPDEATQRQLIALLSARGARVIPVDDADKGLDLAHRVRFDLAFCSVHAPGLNWVELAERMQPRVGAFVLVSDRYDAELAADFESETRFVLSRPVQETELERVLNAVQPGLPAVKNGAA